MYHYYGAIGKAVLVFYQFCTLDTHWLLIAMMIQNGHLW